jgi:hypothetical protein
MEDRSSAGCWCGALFRDIMSALRISVGVELIDPGTPAAKGTPMKRLHYPLATLLMLCLITTARAQRVVFSEDNSRFVGSATWRAERVAPGPGQKADVVVRAEIEIPEQKVRVSMTMRRNDNPVGHAVELVFTLPPDFPHGGILIIPGIRMKEGEATRPVPLTAIGSRVTANFFRVGLPDGAGNIQRLKEQPWFEIPVIYADNKRAIIDVEKGIPGERAFTEAFAAWGQ